MPTDSATSLIPPFTRDTAAKKVRMAEDSWNTRDPHKVSLAYAPDSVWRIALSSSKGARRSLPF